MTCMFDGSTSIEHTARGASCSLTYFAFGNTTVDGVCVVGAYTAIVPSAQASEGMHVGKKDSQMRPQ